MNSNAVQGLLALLEAVQSLNCPLCEHAMKYHVDRYGCEIDLGDGYRHAEFQEALGPCGCDTDELEEDYPDFAKVLEALRSCGA